MLVEENKEVALSSFSQSSFLALPPSSVLAHQPLFYFDLALPNLVNLSQCHTEFQIVSEVNSKKKKDNGALCEYFVGNLDLDIVES